MSEQTTSWSRRGHSRKPNVIVRGMYAAGDWLGDFGHLASTAKRGAGHVSSFAGYSLLLIVTFVITISIIVTSAIHSIELLHYIGFSDWMAYPILFAVEAIFLTGSIQIDLSLKHGLPLFGRYFKPSPPILGFVAGLAFVLPSNIFGLADNYGGLIFGTATPFLLIIAKAMLAWQYSFKKQVAEQVKVTEIATEKAVESEPKNEPKPGQTFTEKMDTEKVDEALGLQPLSEANETEKVVESKPEAAQKNEPETTEKAVEHEPENEPKAELTKTEKPVKSERKQSVKKMDKRRFNKIQRAYELLCQELGKAPGRNRLAKRANVTLTEAQKFLTEIKTTPQLRRVK